MPTPKKGARLGGSPAHQKLILANLATQLIGAPRDHHDRGQGQASPALLREARHQGQGGDMHARRTVAKKITSKEAVYLLFDEVARRSTPSVRAATPV